MFQYDILIWVEATLFVGEVSSFGGQDLDLQMIFPARNLDLQDFPASHV